MENIKIEIAKDFSEKLGGRWRRLGPFSGEEFYEVLLKVKYLRAIDEGQKLHIYLDGTKGYGSSFLDQSFGQLAREFEKNKVNDTIVFHTAFFQWNVNYIKKQIWGIE